jgi:hypothetical protein
MFLRRVLVLGIVCSVAGFSCFSTARYDTAHAWRVGSINKQHYAESKALEARYDELLRSFDDFRKFLIPVEDGGNYAPVSRVSARAEIAACSKTCGEYFPPSLDPDGKAKAECLKTICQKLYIDAVLATYYRADVSWVTEQLSTYEKGDMESLLAFSHNQSILGYVDEQRRAVEDMRAQARLHLAEKRRNELNSSWQQRESEVAVGYNAHRSRMMAVASALSSLGSAAGRRATAPSAPEGVYAAGNTCTSDFSCGVGYECVKPTYSSSGTCMKSVNEYGNPNYQAPKLESIGSNMSSGCRLAQDCPMGFQCDSKSGRCLR